MNILVGTGAYNEYWQNMALALEEAGSLGAYFTGFVDHYPSGVRALRELLGRSSQTVDQALRRRRLGLVPDSKIYSRPGWELLRTIATRARIPAPWVDWIFIQSEYGLDLKCADALKGPAFDGFLGIEHGSLAALTQARASRKTGTVVFVSPHHTFRRYWVDAEYETFPELQTPATKKLLALGVARDERRDNEMKEASHIITCSPLISRTLVAAGVSPDKIAAVPLGAPEAIPENLLPRVLSQPLRFMYAGPVSVRKGAHYLLQAWKKLGSPRGSELHFYGEMLLPSRCVDDAAENVFFHGSVSRDELFRAYRQSAILVFPTLCDGFGAVVTEALSQGLPVITTENAGAASFVQEGVSGFMTPARESERLAERMGWCIDHPPELLDMRRGALAAARRWSWPIFRQAFRDAMRPSLVSTR